MQERTAELERLNGELARAKTAAEDANLSKTRFLAAAGHDILQPLNAARLYASSLTESAADAGPEERVSLARNVDASLEAVEEILGALLDISRLDAGATRPEIADFPVQDMFRQLEIEFAPMARAKGLKLTFRRRPRSILRSDRRLMRRLLQNFVSNAIKYTLKGRVLVGCRRARRRRADRGLGHRPRHPRGQAARDLRRVPAPRSGRARRARPRPRPVDRRAARARARPSRSTCARGPARGSVFSVEAPLGARGPALAAEARRAEPALAGASRCAGLRVLAIDNEPRVLEGMRMLLEKWGCRVAVAPGVAERARRRSSPPPDVIIADYHLDDGDGLAAIAASARDARLSDAGDSRDRRPQRRRCATPRARRTWSCSTSR